jgi:hypothetical protein
MKLSSIAHRVAMARGSVVLDENVFGLTETLKN